ncbi:hypothetical protein ES703_37457 [subsurface metagenome]
MVDKVSELAELAAKLSDTELRLLLAFADFLAWHKS